MCDGTCAIVVEQFRRTVKFTHNLIIGEFDLQLPITVSVFYHKSTLKIKRRKYKFSSTFETIALSSQAARQCMSTVF